MKELALLFLKLGTIAFGGPAAHIGMMEEEIVRRRRWLSRDEFLDMLGATNLIPGPNSTEMAIHIGHRRGGWMGLLIAGICFILPAALIVTAFAWAYVEYGSLPAVMGILYGVKPVIIAVVLQALWGLSRAAVKNRFLAAVGAAGVAFAFLGLHELLILLGGGIVVGAGGWIIRRIKEGRGDALSLILGFPFALMIVVTYQLGPAAIVDPPTGLLALFSAFVLILFHVNSAWLVLGGAFAGFFLQVFFRT